MTTLYGIKSCDTVRKARRWLESEGIDYRYHDLREDGLEQSTLERWVEQLGVDTVLNRRSTTWKQLPQSQRDALDPAASISLMLKHPTLIKRPVLDAGSDCQVGFKSGDWENFFSHHRL